MNKEEMGLFNDLWHIGTDMMSWDYKEPADKLKEKIIKTFEEKKQLETNRDEAIGYIKYCQVSDKDIFPVIEAEKMIEILERR